MCSVRVTRPDPWRVNWKGALVTVVLVGFGAAVVAVLDSGPPPPDDSHVRVVADLHPEGLPPSDAVVASADPDQVWRELALSGEPPRLHEDERLLVVARLVLDPDCDRVDLESAAIVDGNLFLALSGNRTDCPGPGEPAIFVFALDEAAGTPRYLALDDEARHEVRVLA